MARLNRRVASQSSGRTASLGTFGSTRALGVRPRRAPKKLLKPEPDPTQTHRRSPSAMRPEESARMRKSLGHEHDVLVGEGRAAGVGEGGDL